LNTKADEPGFTFEGILESILRRIVREEIREALREHQPGKQNQNPYLTIKEAAQLSRLASSTIRLYIRQRKLSALREGRRVIIKRKDLEMFLEANPITAIADRSS